MSHIINPIAYTSPITIPLENETEIECNKCNKSNKFFKITICDCGKKYHNICIKGFKCSCSKIFNTFNMKKTLFPFQNKTYQWMNQKPKGGLLALDMGLGKTMIMMKYYVDNFNDKNIHIIIVPKNLLDQWYKYIINNTDITPSKINKYYGSNRNKDFHKYYLIITTYGLAHEIQNFMINNLIHKYVNIESILLDECHIIRNHRTQKFKNIQLMKQFVNKIWLLSGTPIVNGKNDYSNLSKLYDTDINTFHKEFVYSLKKTDDDVELPIPLPKKFYYNFYIELSDEHYKQYNKLKQLNPRKIVNILRLRQAAIHPDIAISNQHYIDNIHYNIENKFKTTINIIQNILTLSNNKDSIIIFTQFNRVKQYIHKFLDNHNIKSIIYTSNLNEFNSDGSKILICNTITCNYGLNLQKANHIIFIDQPWNPAAYNQAVDRSYRIGQYKSVYIYNLYSHNTIDNWIIEIINYKQNIIDNVLENKHDEQHDHKENKIKLNELLNNLVNVDEQLLINDDDNDDENENEHEHEHENDDIDIDLNIQYDNIRLRNDIQTKSNFDHSLLNKTYICNQCKKPIHDNIFIDKIGTYKHTHNCT